ncbi:MAG TPA: hypothetical protein VEH06_09810 [Candidatus Bathyarchaeia archaeon]|nr:hypothetical protein [Candidatus Bathyarchaeia archaeon]
MIKTTLGGLLAYNSTYASFTTRFSSPCPERSTHIGAIEGDNLFILIYKAMPNEYDKYMAIVQQSNKQFNQIDRHHTTCKQIIVIAHILRIFQPRL